MGLFDDDDFELDELLETVKKYPSYVTELNEGIVQEIFNRCLATNDTPKEDIRTGHLFHSAFGYKPEDLIIFYFDKNKLLANERIIRYLVGQLKSIHNKHNKYDKYKHYIEERMSVEDAFYNYSGEKWSNSKAPVLELLCLGSTPEALSFFEFEAQTNSAVIPLGFRPPTLSPKDPDFPDWWEAHKAEWESK